MIRHAGSYAATAMGFILGSVGGVLLVGFIGTFVFSAAGFDSLGVFIQASIIGAVIGSMLAVWACCERVNIR